MKRDIFKSKLGVVVATAGSAIGLGNLWGFPFKAGTNGGGLFVMLYIFCALFIGVPVMLSEFIVGRYGEGGPVQSFENIEKGKKSPFILGGYIGIISSFLILSFYSVIAGWSIHYLANSLMYGIKQYEIMDTSKYFNTTTSNVVTQTVYQCVFILLTASVVVLGIQNGIEKISKIMMPLLFFIVIILAIYSTTLPGFNEAVGFLFKYSGIPDGKTFFSVFSSALGQAFFSLSLGVGIIITYARSTSDNMNINNITLQVVFCDIFVSLLAGIATFPIILSYGISITEGTGLAFIALPVGFSTMPLGYIVGNLFFLLLLLAALTSAMSLLENTSTIFLEKFQLSREITILFLSILTMIFGFASQIGLNYSLPILSFTGGTILLEQLDIFTMNYLNPIGALFIVLLVGYRIDKKVIKEQIKNDKITKIFIPYVRYVIPITILFILISGVLNI